MFSWVGNVKKQYLCSAAESVRYQEPITSVFINFHARFSDTAENEEMADVKIKICEWSVHLHLSTEVCIHVNSSACCKQYKQFKDMKNKYWQHVFTVDGLCTFPV